MAARERQFKRQNKLNAWLIIRKYANSASLRAKMRSGWRNTDPSGVIDSCLAAVIESCRTIADIDQSDIITRQHLQEALAIVRLTVCSSICKNYWHKKGHFALFINRQNRCSLQHLQLRFTAGKGVKTFWTLDTRHILDHTRSASVTGSRSPRHTARRVSLPR